MPHFSKLTRAAAAHKVERRHHAPLGKRGREHAHRRLHVAIQRCCIALVASTLHQVHTAGLAGAVCERAGRAAKPREWRGTASSATSGNARSPLSQQTHLRLNRLTLAEPSVLSSLVASRSLPTDARARRWRHSTTGGCQLRPRASSTTTVVPAWVPRPPPSAGVQSVTHSRAAHVVGLDHRHRRQQRVQLRRQAAVCARAPQRCLVGLKARAVAADLEGHVGAAPRQ